MCPHLDRHKQVAGLAAVLTRMTGVGYPHFHAGFDPCGDVKGEGLALQDRPAALASLAGVFDDPAGAVAGLAWDADGERPPLQPSHPLPVARAARLQTRTWRTSGAIARAALSLGLISERLVASVDALHEVDGHLSLDVLSPRRLSEPRESAAHPPEYVGEVREHPGGVAVKALKTPRTRRTMTRLVSRHACLVVEISLLGI
mmetsp:Transcript_36145/g.90195  ORF Transcript_36145/g.90195 Transcript_36145/m.90195 type:complete len:202 (+) Transcript_36145:535-1140(+)